MKKKILIGISILIAIIGCFCGMYFNNQELDNSISTIQNIVNNEIEKYEMSEKEIAELSSTEIIEQSVEDEVNQEQEVEDEGFELQGNIAYEGDRAISWDVELGDYKGLTYYSQIDSRWKNKMYSSVSNSSQTIGSSGCGPTSAAIIVTATKGAITPDKMSELFVKYGYRSANDGTYWSAFRAIADEFNINYKEIYNFNTAIDLLRNNHYIVCSVGNGLFTTGGHFIVLTKIENNIISVYDPYLYNGKFDLSTRRGKATVEGNTVYVSVDNFRNYANYKCFFCYEHDGEVKEGNSKPIVYVDTKPKIENTVGQTRKLRACNLYSNSDLTGKRYDYRANTTITILENVTSNIDRIRVNANGRIAYINTSNYTSTVKSYSTVVKNATAGKYKRLRTNCILYSNSNLSGTRYNYLANTQVKIIRNVSSTVDYVYVVKTKRYAYIRNNLYK